MQITHNIQKVAGAVLLSVVFISPVIALDLDQAKAEGLVGETNSGYIAAVKPSAKVKALLTDVNDQRKKHYQKIATKNGISLQAVEARAGQKAIEKTPAGDLIDTGQGWQKK